MCTDARRRPRPGRQAGLTIVELILFMVVVSVGIAGILSVMNFTASRSADPLVTKQAAAIAESLLEEIELQSFTFCDPSDPLVYDTTVNASPACSIPENFGPEAGESRTTFNNVNDYVSASGTETQVQIVDVSVGDNAQISALSAYAAFVTITPEAIGGIPAADSLRIDVRVTGPGGVNLKLTGYRTRYAPHAG